MVKEQLLKRGFDARLPDRYTKKYDVLAEICGLRTTPLQVMTVHIPPWYVRSSRFVGAAADRITVYVLLGARSNSNSARFFVVRNSDLQINLRQPHNWSSFGFIDLEAVEQYEDNWDLLRAFSDWGR